MSEKRVYTFGNGQAEGDASMREVLGGKGANLAEMNHIGVPVPPGFTITTDTCNEYYEVGQDKIVELLTAEVDAAVAHTEELMNCKFGDPKNPLLVSVRSGARASMPGMMDTILNLGLNDEVAEGMVEKTGNPHFVYDSYRRFVQMYGDVVLGMKPENKEDIDPFEAIIEKVKEEQGVVLDKDLSVESLKKLVELFKKAIKEQTGSDFPTDPKEQLWGAICAVFRSWMNERAILYRKMEGIPDEWGTAVSVMAMVFGNMGETSATGVCFSRDAGNGENLFNGEYLINAQGEDVVAGIRTPQQITKIGSQRWAERAGISEEERVANYPSMEEAMPELYKELDSLQDKLEKHYRDMQDMEFTVQEGKLWFLQTRNGKRTGTAMVKIAMDLLHEGMIDEKTALLRCEPQKLDELLHPVFDKLALSRAKVITQGLPASPGAACGQIVFHADDAEVWHEDGKKVIMVRIETSPEDLAGMSAAEGILTARGGMTSHAAVVARGMGKCCVSGAGSINVDYKCFAQFIMRCSHCIYLSPGFLNAFFFFNLLGAFFLNFSFFCFLDVKLYVSRITSLVIHARCFLRKQLFGFLVLVKVNSADTSIFTAVFVGAIREFLYAKAFHIFAGKHLVGLVVKRSKSTAIQTPREYDFIHRGRKILLYGNFLG